MGMAQRVDWAAVRRPLQIPALKLGGPCPRTEGRPTDPAFGLAVGNGPVYATLPFIGAANLDPRRPLADGWYGTKVIWLISPNYDGPVLIRGHQIDGSGGMRFIGGETAEQGSELRLVGVGGVAADAPGWNFWTSGISVPTTGCYAYQVDGTDFSEVVVFEAVGQRPEELTPLPRTGSLPNELYVTAAVKTAPTAVRLAMLGAGGLAVQVDVRPTQSSPILPRGLETKRFHTTTGDVLWRAHPQHGGVELAIWDDGARRFQVTVRGGGARPWLEADLRVVVEAFRAAGGARPPPAGG